MAALAADAGMPGALVPTAAVLSCVVPALDHGRRRFPVLTAEHAGLGAACKPARYPGAATTTPRPRSAATALPMPWRGAPAVYGSPCIVIDLGTTTNIEVIDAHGTLWAGLAPGLALGARSAWRLRRVYPGRASSAPTHVIGHNTREAMRSGVAVVT